MSNDKGALHQYLRTAQNDAQKQSYSAVRVHLECKISINIVEAVRDTSSLFIIYKGAFHANTYELLGAMAKKERYVINYSTVGDR